MSKTLQIILGAVGVALIGQAGYAAIIGLNNHNLLQNSLRPCIFAPAGAEAVTATAAASDASSELNYPSRYAINCLEEAYIDTGATAPTASSADWVIPADTVMFFMTTASNKFVAGRNVATDGSCYIWECQ